MTYLNEKTGRPFEFIPTNLDLIAFRFKERSGLTVDECKLVIDHKCQEWLLDDKTKVWLRPTTLFGKEKFSQYLPAAKAYGGGIRSTAESKTNKYKDVDNRANDSLQRMGIKID